jgi:hypothetical protein
MSSPRPQILVAGSALALAAGVLIDQGSHLGADLPRTALLGVALGAVVGLVPDRTVTARTGGFVTGLLAAWVGYALRAGFLPDIAMGRAIAAVTVIGVVTAVATATAGRVPLWSGLLGAGAMAGAYEAAFAATPTSFVTDSMTAVTTTLLASALAIVVVGALADTPRELDADEGEDVPLAALMMPAPRASVDADVEQEVRS